VFIKVYGIVNAWLRLKQKHFSFLLIFIWIYDLIKKPLAAYKNLENVYLKYKFPLRVPMFSFLEFSNSKTLSDAFKNV
jgi:hypothetical protein